MSPNGRCPESASVSFRVRLFPAAAGRPACRNGQCRNKFHNFHTVSHQTLLRTPSQSTDTIYSYACRLFDELWDGTPIRLLGIRTSKLSGQDTVQMNLFEPETSQKLRKLDKALDDIRRKYGKDAVVGAAFLNKSKTGDSPIRSEHLRKIPCFYTYICYCFSFRPQFIFRQSPAGIPSLFLNTLEK